MNVNRRTENRNLNRTTDWRHRGIRRAAPLAFDIGKEIVCVCPAVSTAGSRLEELAPLLPFV